MRFNQDFTLALSVCFASGPEWVPRLFVRAQEKRLVRQSTIRSRANNAKEAKDPHSVNSAARNKPEIRDEHKFKKDHVDVGVLSKPGVSLHRNLLDRCTEGYVSCNAGMSVDNPDDTCEEACAGKCCTGASPGDFLTPCQGFTGDICMDGSCDGGYACTKANITKVIGSCKGGSSCYQAGKDGAVGVLANSCLGDVACFQVGKGVVEEIVDSCNDVKACAFAAQKLGGSIGTIERSCNIEKGCYALASNGRVEIVSDSCLHGVSACQQVAYYGNVGAIQGSCNYGKACYQMAYRGDIENVIDSCRNEESCNRLAYDGGSEIEIVRNCCLDSGECSNLSFQNELPYECNVYPPSSTPSMKPSIVPSFKPSSAPTLSVSPSVLPSNRPSVTDLVILPKVESILSGVGELLSATDRGCDVSIIDMEVQILQSSQGWWWDDSYEILVVVKDGGVFTTPDSGPNLYTFEDGFGASEVEVPITSIDEFATGKYRITFSSNNQVFWVTSIVQGKEHGVTFNVRS